MKNYEWFFFLLLINFNKSTGCLTQRSEGLESHLNDEIAVWTNNCRLFDDTTVKLRVENEQDVFSIIQSVDNVQVERNARSFFPPSINLF